MNSVHPDLRIRDWVRFQLKSEKLVREGFIQEISEDGQWIKIGPSPESVETKWFSVTSVEILRHQTQEIAA
jgi:hypothetical protein